MPLRYASYEEKFNPQRYAFTTIPCPKCGKQEVIEVQAPDLYKYNQGAFMQDAFPYLTPSQRERLMTGICGPCFDKLFPPEEEEEDADDPAL